MAASIAACGVMAFVFKANAAAAFAAAATALAMSSLELIEGAADAASPGLDDPASNEKFFNLSAILKQYLHVDVDVVICSGGSEVGQGPPNMDIANN